MKCPESSSPIIWDSMLHTLKLRDKFRTLTLLERCLVSAALFGDTVEWKLWQVVAYYLDQSSPLTPAFDIVQDNKSYLMDQVYFWLISLSWKVVGTSLIEYYENILFRKLAYCYFNFYCTHLSHIFSSRLFELPSIILEHMSTSDQESLGSRNMPNIRLAPSTLHSPPHTTGKHRQTRAVVTGGSTGLNQLLSRLSPSITYIQRLR